MKHSPSRHSQTQNEEMQYKKGHERIQHDYEQGKPSVEFIVQILLVYLIKAEGWGAFIKFIVHFRIKRINQRCQIAKFLCYRVISFLKNKSGLSWEKCQRRSRKKIWLSYLMNEGHKDAQSD